MCFNICGTNRDPDAQRLRFGGRRSLEGTKREVIALGKCFKSSSGHSENAGIEHLIKGVIKEFHKWRGKGLDCTYVYARADTRCFCHFLI